MSTFTDQEFLEFLVKSIVDHPDDVKVERRVDEMGVLLLLHVNPQDMGQVVGRQGATAKAIRSLLRIVGIKNDARVNLKIEEPEGSTRGTQQPQQNVQRDAQPAEEPPAASSETDAESETGAEGI
jgi:predicted RNA-binding protein YlqC (UPF0109 family)